MADPVAVAVPPQGNKYPWLSKTLWFNVIVGIAAFFPPVQAFVQGHSEMIMMGFGLINMFLRLITKDAISLQD